MTPTGHPAPAWFDISSPEAPRARRFYQEMSGWPVSLLDETYALVSGEDGQPADGIGQAGPGSPCTGIVVYFRVDDIDDALARAVALGGTRVMAPAEMPVSRIAAFADPDGNLVGLPSR
jgi:hypothetical protein